MEIETGICPKCKKERTTRFLHPEGEPCFMCFMEEQDKQQAERVDEN